MTQQAQQKVGNIMGFVLEKISDEDCVKHGLIKPQERLTDIWAVDHERDAYLIYKTREIGGSIVKYLLFWKGVQIEVDVNERTTNEQRVPGVYFKYDIIRSLNYLLIPESLKNNTPLLKELTVEALTSYRHSESVANVIIENLENVDIRILGKHASTMRK